MRNRRLKAGEAAPLLLGLIPLISKGTQGEEISDDRASLGVVSDIIERAIEQSSLEPLIEALPWARAIMVARIHAFAIYAQGSRQKPVATYSAGDDERARIIAALNAIVHHSPGRERPREDKRPFRS